MLLPEVWELFEYWSEYPPAHVILAARYRISPDSDRGEATGSEQMVLNSLGMQGKPAGLTTLPSAVQAAIAQMKAPNG